MTSHFDQIVKLAKFKTAAKRQLKYKRVNSLDDASKKSFYVHTDDKTADVITVIDNKTEVKNVVAKGDAVITGTKGEKYVVRLSKFLDLYNVMDGVAMPRLLKRQVAEVTPQIWKKVVPPNTKFITFQTAWGEQMTLEKGDFIVKDQKHYYRVAKTAFKDTYEFV